MIFSLRRLNMNKKQGNGTRAVLIVLCIILALILALLVGATVWVETTLNRINQADDETLSPEQLESLRNETVETDPDFTGPVIDENDITMPSGPAVVIDDSENIVQIMLVGQDRRPGQGRQRSDAMILCTVNKKEKTLTMTSFMRDTYVTIPGYWNDRMNGAYQFGGFTALYDTLEYNFGVKVDHGIEVDFSGFEKIIDLVGGVDIELTSSEASYLNRRGNWDVDDASAGTWLLKEGMNHLTGEQALAYSRIRAIGNDFGRTSRQRTVLTALIEKAKTLSLTEMYKLVDGFIPLITTDMENSDIIGYVVDLFPLLSDLEIVSQRIPADGDYQNATLSSGAQVLMPDLDACQQLLKDTIGQ